jgi:hypothetical protein
MLQGKVTLAPCNMHPASCTSFKSASFEQGLN